VTVQGTLTDIVRQVSGEDIEIIGGSRTDSGTHAVGQVVHFDANWPAEPAKIPRIINNLLPGDIAVQKATVVKPDFHARFSAISRTYRYRLRQTPRNPLESRFVHDIWRKLNIEVMNDAAQVLVGSHDFLAFSEETEPTANAVREVFSAQVQRSGREVWIEITGNAFMRGMMRRISGGLYEVGRGRRSVEDFSKLLDPRHRSNLMWPVVLPAKGLCLLKIKYGRHPRDFRERYQTISQETGT